MSASTEAGIAAEWERSSALLTDTVIRNREFIPVQPTTKQWAFLADIRREVLFGGSAGPGKSTSLLISALQYVHVPNYRALILRRTYPDLRQPGGLMDVAEQWLSRTSARRVGDGRRWEFPSGAVLVFGHMAAEKDRHNYQGAEYHFVGWDELTTFTQEQYLYLFSRARRPATDAEGESALPIRVRSTANPGGIGHDWVRARFVDPQPPGTETDRGFIPATLSDNPHLDVTAYRAMLANLDPVTRRQLEHGDWTVTPDGGFFTPSALGVVDAHQFIAASALEAPGGRRPVRVRGWDLAATEGRGDWSAGVLVAWLPGSRLWLIEDVVRVRQEPGALERTLRATAERDGRTVNIVIEQEGGSSGKMAMRDLRTRVLHGFPMRAVSPTGSKIERARLPAANIANGDVRIARGPWNAAFLDELGAFPSGSHDDQCDALSYSMHAIARNTGGSIGFHMPKGRISEIAGRPSSLPQLQRRIIRAQPGRDGRWGT